MPTPAGPPRPAGPLQQRDIERSVGAALRRLPHVAVAVYDHGLRIVHADGGALERLGLDAIGALGRPITDVLALDAGHRATPALRAALEGETTRVAYRTAMSSQAMEAELSPVRDDEGRVVGGLACAIDVSEREEARRTLRRLEREYRLAVEEGSDVVTVCDLDGTVRWVSPCVRAVLGWRPEQLVGRRQREMIHPDDLAGLREVLVAAVRERRAASWTARHRHRHGHWVWCETRLRPAEPADPDAGDAGAFVTITRDVTTDRERVAALRALRAERDALAAEVAVLRAEGAGRG